jgi:hypothetical protein
VEGIREPLTRSLHTTLRRAVLEHAVSERRRVFAPLLHVGTPGGPQALFAPVPLAATDHALRTDVVAALLRHTSGLDDRLVWLTRPGDLELQDVDAAWLAAARAAGAEAGVPLTMVVVTRHGWRDPRSGAGQTWKRLRAR